MSRSPRPARWLIVMRLALVVALAASAALFVDYSAAIGTYCGAGGGCDAVKASRYAMLFGVLPVPVIGLVGFSLVLIVSLWPNHQRRDLLLGPIVYAGAAIAVAMMLIQWLDLGQFCWLCMTTDSAAVVAAGACLLHGRARAAQHGPGVELLRPWAWLCLAGLAILAPLLWPQVKQGPAAPPGIASFYRPGELNIVEFSDFQCPFCRVLHGRLKRVLADFDGRVNLVRLNFPLSQHERARGAARAAVCADDQGLGDPMIEALFDSERLDSEAIGRLAERVGLDTELFTACLTAAATDARIDRESKILEAIGFEGLPTTFIGDQKIVGAVAESHLLEALERAEVAGSSDGLSGALYGALLALGVALVLGLGLARRPSSAPARPPR